MEKDSSEIPHRWYLHTARPGHLIPVVEYILRPSLSTSTPFVCRGTCKYFQRMIALHSLFINTFEMRRSVLNVGRIHEGPASSQKIRFPATISSSWWWFWMCGVGMCVPVGCW